jgi:hypothetical protein
VEEEKKCVSSEENIVRNYILFRITFVLAHPLVAIIAEISKTASSVSREPDGYGSGN